MNFPFYGFNTPGLQLGENNGWMNQTNTIQPMPTAQPFANQVSPWQTDLSSAVQGQTYSTLGLDASGMYNPTGASAGGMSNWLSGNADLLKAGVGLFTGGASAWNGLQQNRLMRDNMNQQASMFREQMDLSKSNYNSKLEDRQRARVASNPTAYESVDSYMKKYGAK
ncbi:hypothetical protein nACB1_013 [Acinetobacter phage nACB1]|nr:hypothetical protein nACB1_013 [Acinetobacter phage nACB1]